MEYNTVGKDKSADWRAAAGAALRSQIIIIYPTPLGLLAEYLGYRSNM